MKKRWKCPKIGRFSFLGQQKDNRKQNPVIIGTGTYLLFKVASAAQKPSRVLYLDDIIILSEGVIPWYR